MTLHDLIILMTLDQRNKHLCRGTMKYNKKCTSEYIPKLQINQHSLLTKKVFSWHNSSTQVFITGSSSKLDHHHHWIIITGSSSLDHNQRWIITLVQTDELATRWLKILVTTSFSSDLLLNMRDFDWPNYKRLKLTTNLVTS